MAVGNMTFSNARKCLRCGWEWIRRKEEQEPVRCPRCRSERWNKQSDRVLVSK